MSLFFRVPKSIKEVEQHKHHTPLPTEKGKTKTGFIYTSKHASGSQQQAGCVSFCCHHQQRGLVDDSPFALLILQVASLYKGSNTAAGDLEEEDGSAESSGRRRGREAL